MLSSVNEVVEYLYQNLPFLGEKPQTLVHQPPCTIGSTISRSCFHFLFNSFVGMRVAGLCGALSIGLGAYGAHAFRDNPNVTAHQKLVFGTASRYHLIHSVVLLTTPLSRYPTITRTLFLVGLLVFCGTCYHYGITGKEDYQRFTPYGGMLLIAAWLSFII